MIVDLWTSSHGYWLTINEEVGCPKVVEHAKISSCEALVWLYYQYLCKGRSCFVWLFVVAVVVVVVVWNDSSWLVLSQWTSFFVTCYFDTFSCHTYLPRPWRHWYWLLGTKWQLSRSCPRDSQTSMFFANKTKIGGKLLWPILWLW